MKRARSTVRRLMFSRRAKFFSEFDGSWAEAVQTVSGYGSENIVQQVREALSAVRDGRATHERDGVLFPDIQYSWPLLAGILAASADNRGDLNVLDFGGSLGSSFFQNRKYLALIPKVTWTVVEQESFVRIGRDEFQTDILRFEDNLSTALDTAQPHVALFSSSLQYLEVPHTFLEKISKSQVQHLIIDRTPFHSGVSDLLTIQTVPPEIYMAQYPAWILSLPRFEQQLESHWQLISRFDTLEQPMKTRRGTDFFWQGAHYVRRAS